MTFGGFLFLRLPEYLAKLLRHKRTRAAGRGRRSAAVCRSTGRRDGRRVRRFRCSRCGVFGRHLLFQSLDVLGGRRAVSVLLAALLELAHRLQSRPDTRVHNMSPVAFTAGRESLEALHEEDTRVADLALAGNVQLEALDEVDLVALRVCEPRTTRLGLADATALRGSVHFWFVEGKHLQLSCVFFVLVALSLQLLVVAPPLCCAISLITTSTVTD